MDEKTEKKFWAIIEGDVTYEDIKNISFAKQSLVVNVGAKVMLTANDANGEYVNGKQYFTHMPLSLLPSPVFPLAWSEY